MPLIEERNGIYYADDWVIDPRTKKRRRIRRSSGTRDFDEAREWYGKISTDFWRQRKLGERRAYSWKEATVEYMTGRESRPSYLQDVQRVAWLDDHLGELMLAQIDEEVIETVRRARVADRKKDGTLVATSTVNRLMTFIRAVLNHARRLKWVSEMPIIQTVKVPEKRPVYLEDSEVDALLAELADKPRTAHLVDFVVLAVDCGLRMRNVTHLKWSDIDMQRKSLWIEVGNTKGNRHIAIPLTDAAVEVLKRNLGGDLVYVLTHRGKPYDRVNQRTLQGAAKRIGITKHITPHTLRHTFATRLVRLGVHPFEIMELGGWSKLESVQIYTHFSPERLRATANRASHFSRKSDGDGRKVSDDSA